MACRGTAASATLNTLPCAAFWDPYRSCLLGSLTQVPAKFTLLWSVPCSRCPVPVLLTAAGGYAGHQSRLASHWQLSLQSLIPRQGKLPCPQQPAAAAQIPNLTSSGSKDHRLQHTRSGGHRYQHGLQLQHEAWTSAWPPEAA